MVASVPVIVCAAHGRVRDCRLETIMDSDRIIVMDQGVVVEFDSPLALLDRGAGGVLYELCEATGNMAQLRDIASGHATL